MELRFDIDSERRELAREAYSAGHFLYRLLDLSEIVGDESCPIGNTELAEMAGRLQEWAVDGAAGLDDQLALELRQRAEGHQAFRHSRHLLRQSGQPSL